jgi:hypothetical protein
MKFSPLGESQFTDIDSVTKYLCKSGWYEVSRGGPALSIYSFCGWKHYRAGNCSFTHLWCAWQTQSQYDGLYFAKLGKCKE